MGRRPIGKKGEKPVNVSIRWSESTIAGIDRVRGCQERNTFIREAVEREIDRRDALLKRWPEILQD